MLETFDGRLRAGDSEKVHVINDHTESSEFRRENAFTLCLSYRDVLDACAMEAFRGSLRRGCGQSSKQLAAGRTPSPGTDACLCTSGSIRDI